jgi:hypothetical protein
MKMTYLKYGILFALAVGLALPPLAGAAHAAAFLDPLATDVATRLESPPPDLTPEQERALNSAAKTLSRNSKTLGTDLNLLAKAGTSLDAAFPEDSAFSTLENNALNNYIAEAQAQMNAINDRIGTNEAPISISNQLASAQEALDQANDSSNSVPVRARAVAFALNKIRVADTQSNRFFKAPASLDGRTVTLTGKGGFGVTLEPNGTYTIPGDPEETGTWSYERTGPATGVITASPSGGGAHTLNLTFSNSTRGKFNGVTASDETVNGSFTVSGD